MRIGRSQRFDQARPFVVLGLAIAAWLVAPDRDEDASTRASFFEMTAPDRRWPPPTRATSRSSGPCRLHSKDELIEAGRDMARLNASYSLSVQQNARAPGGGRSGCRLCSQCRRSEHFRFEHARVAQRDFSGWWQRMVIRKGADYGIPVGAPVVYAGGVVGPHLRGPCLHVRRPADQRPRSPDRGHRRRRHAADQLPGRGEPGVRRRRSGVVEFVPLDIYASGSAAEAARDLRPRRGLPARPDDRPASSTSSRARTASSRPARSSSTRGSRS